MADCCRRDPREFRTIATLQRDSGGGTYDSFGQETKAWIDDSRIAVKIEALSGQEIEQARSLYARATYRVYTRWRDGMTTRKRLKVGDRVLNIGHVDNINSWADITMLCAEDAPTS